MEAIELINPYSIPVAAIAALLIGSIWYNPSFGFGNAWAREAGMTEEKMKKGNMGVILGLSLLFAAMICVVLMQNTNHQFGILGLLGGDFENAKDSVTPFIADYGSAYRTIKHGAIHGTIMGIMFVLPIIGTIALFERKSWKYIFINAGYWIVTLAAMGGILCGWR